MISTFDVRYLAITFTLLFGCTPGPGKQEITGLDSTQNVYLNAYEEAERAYASEPSVQLLNQKLFYLEKLDWPPMAINTLEDAKDQMGLTEDLVKKYILYYEKHEQYAPLMELLSTWGKLNDLDAGLMESNIEAHMLLSPREKTMELINEYLYEYDQSDNLAFAADKVLKLGDTLMSIYHYSKLYRQDPMHEDLISNYVPLLLEIGQPSRAKSILSRYAEGDSSPQTRLFLSRSLYQIGDRRGAKSILQSQPGPEALEQLTLWYWQEKNWDSTMFYVNRLIQIDSSSQALMMKASVYEERGSLKASLDLLNLLIEKDSSNNLARDMAQDVSRKITYLRELEEKRNRPIPEISPKTSVENE